MKIVQLTQLNTSDWGNPHTLIVYATQPYVSLPIYELRMRFPDIRILGTSSHHGVFTPLGFRRGVYGFLFEEEDGPSALNPKLVDFDMPGNVRSQIADAIRSMPVLSRDGRRKFTINCTPGCEERVIEGIVDACGNEVDVIGGSAGYDKFLQRPYVFLNEHVSCNGALIYETSILQETVYTSMSGYLLTPHSGVITKAEGRLIYEIDGLPAAEVFDRWTEGRFSSEIMRDNELPRSSARFPLGRIREDRGDLEIWLTHAFGVYHGALKVYSEIPAGTTVCLMRGSADRIMGSLKLLIHGALSRVPTGRVKAAVLCFCAGCMSLIAERIHELSSVVCEEFGDIPFLGFSSYGEQGRLAPDETIMHGNMMVNLMLIMK